MTPAEFEQPNSFSNQPVPQENSSPPVIVRCSWCGKPFDRVTSPVMPFCSSRCQQIDLGNWFGGRYSIPGEEESRAEDQPEPGSKYGDE
jgi:hypothetical protein